MTQKTFLIYGTSKGLGRAIAQQLPAAGDRIWGVSRTPPTFSAPNLRWIAADLTKPAEAADIVAAQLGQQALDVLIYNVGIWEEKAFSDDYAFEHSPPEEIARLVNVNITACMLAVQRCLGQLKKSTNAKIILIGSTWGLDNHQGKEVAFSASKFALRGIAHALRENLREHRIGVTVLNLGYLDTTPPDTEAADQVSGALIPLSDVMEALRFVLSTSSASCVKEIHMPAMSDTNV